MPKVLSAGERHKLRLIYDMAERRFQAALPPEHYMEAFDHAHQRAVTLASLGLLAGRVPGFHLFNEMLVLYQAGPTEFDTAGVVPDNFVVRYDGPLVVDNSFRLPLQPARPFLVLEYVSTHNQRKDYDDNMTRYQDALRVPYYLLFHPGSQEMSLYKLVRRRFRTVRPDAAGRVAVPELDLQAGVLDGWMRYWYRGDLLPLPAELEGQLTDARTQLDTTRTQLDTTRTQLDTTRTQLDTTRTQLDSTRTQLDSTRTELTAERSARLALEAELARLRAELTGRPAAGG
jgi:hypothetical protein